MGTQTNKGKWYPAEEKIGKRKYITFSSNSDSDNLSKNSQNRRKIKCQSRQTKNPKLYYTKNISEIRREAHGRIKRFTEECELIKINMYRTRKPFERINRISTFYTEQPLRNLSEQKGYVALKSIIDFSWEKEIAQEITKINEKYADKMLFEKSVTAGIKISWVKELTDLQLKIGQQLIDTVWDNKQDEAFKTINEIGFGKAKEIIKLSNKMRFRGLIKEISLLDLEEPSLRKIKLNTWWPSNTRIEL